MHDSISIFDRSLWRKRRTRAAPGFASAGFLKQEAAERLAERLEDITRRFPLALDLGCHDGTFGRVLRGRGGIQRLVEMDSSSAMLQTAGPYRVACDEESLPFAEQSFDAIFSVMSLHWVNDLPGTLIQIRRVLKPDGLFLAVLPGARTLVELRQALGDAESALEGGLRPRISPFVEVRDAGSLLQRAGFALPVVDSEMLTVSYPDPFALMRDLRTVGETNALHERPRHFSRRTTLMEAAGRYQDAHADVEGRIPASFELVTLTAWAPAPGQAQPARRGSGQVNLGDILK